MKKLLTLLIIFSLLHLAASAQDDVPKDWAHRGIKIQEGSGYGQRPMKDIGTQQTKFDTLALKENIALSMAVVLTFISSIFV